MRIGRGDRGREPAGSDVRRRGLVRGHRCLCGSQIRRVVGCVVPVDMALGALARAASGPGSVRCPRRCDRKLLARAFSTVRMDSSTLRPKAVTEPEGNACRGNADSQFRSLAPQILRSLDFKPRPLSSPEPARSAPPRTCSSHGNAGTARAVPCCGSGSACRHGDRGRTRRAP